MPAAATELKRLLGDFNARHGADVSMVVSRTGVPIAHEGSRDVSPETFANLTVTLMNAAEVLYSGMNRPPPTRIVVESSNGTLVASGIGTKALFVALGGKRDDLVRGIDDITAGIRTVLAARG